jgi:hypothetical protein
MWSTAGLCWHELRPGERKIERIDAIAAVTLPSNIEHISFLVAGLNEFSDRQ